MQIVCFVLVLVLLCFDTHGMQYVQLKNILRDHFLDIIMDIEENHRDTRYHIRLPPYQSDNPSITQIPMSKIAKHLDKQLKKLNLRFNPGHNLQDLDSDSVFSSVLRNPFHHENNHTMNNDTKKNQNENHNYNHNHVHNSNINTMMNDDVNGKYNKENDKKEKEKEKENSRSRTPSDSHSSTVHSNNDGHGVGVGVGVGIGKTVTKTTQQECIVVGNLIIDAFYELYCKYICANAQYGVNIDSHGSGGLRDLFEIRIKRRTKTMKERLSFLGNLNLNLMLTPAHSINNVSSNTNSNNTNTNKNKNKNKNSNTNTNTKNEAKSVTNGSKHDKNKASNLGVPNFNMGVAMRLDELRKKGVGERSASSASGSNIGSSSTRMTMPMPVPMAMTMPSQGTFIGSGFSMSTSGVSHGSSSIAEDGIFVTPVHIPTHLQASGKNERSERNERSINDEILINDNDSSENVVGSGISISSGGKSVGIPGLAGNRGVGIGSNRKGYHGGHRGHGDSITIIDEESVIHTSNLGVNSGNSKNSNDNNGSNDSNGTNVKKNKNKNKSKSKSKNSRGVGGVSVGVAIGNNVNVVANEIKGKMKIKEEYERKIVESISLPNSVSDRDLYEWLLTKLIKRMENPIRQISILLNHSFNKFKNNQIIFEKALQLAQETLQ